MRKVWVMHNGKTVEGTVVEDQTKLRHYEVRVDIGLRGKEITEFGPILLVHKDNIKDME